MRGLLFTHFLFKDIFAEWLEYRRGDLKESSLIKYRNIVKTYLLPCFADKDIRTLSYEKVKEYIEELRQSGGRQHKGLSAATLHTIVTVIKSIFSYAVNTKRLKVASLSDLKADSKQKSSCWDAKGIAAGISCLYRRFELISRNLICSFRCFCKERMLVLLALQMTL